ncbi:MAG: HupE/UreJ family protein [Halioglobus sp.]
MSAFKFGFVLLAALFLSTSAHAHRFAPSLLKVTEVGDGQFHMVFKTPAQATTSIPIAPVWPEVCDVASVSPPQLEGTGKVSSLKLDCKLDDEGLVGQTLGLTGLGPNQSSAMMMIALRDGRQYQAVLNAEQSTYVVPQEPGANQVMTDYSLLGMEHIWGGIDHLLFVFGLLLLVGGGKRLLWTITAFTLGHSITLSLVTLGYFDYPVALVEFTIALSIFILAVELTRKSRHDMLWRNPWWLAGGFGLLHGMGFAGALAETGLPQDNVPLALLFFNVGIEIGQIAFIFVVWGVWLILRKPLAPWQDRLLPVPVYILGSLSAMWCIERGLEALA